MQSNEWYPHVDSFEKTFERPSASARRWACALVEFVHRDHRDTPSQTALGTIFRELENWLCISMLRILVFLIQIFLSWYQILERSMTLSLRYSYYSPYQDKLSLIFWSRLMMSFLCISYHDIICLSANGWFTSYLLSYYTVMILEFSINMYKQY